MGLVQWSLREKVFFFIVIPLFIILIYLLPSSLKDAFFILSKQTPSILSMFLSNYTHSEFWHLMSNLTFYLIVIYLIMKFETNKLSFYVTLAVLFLIAPFIISFITIAYVPAINSQGFSGIVAGLMGYFMYVAYRYVKDVWKLKADISFVYLLFCTNVLVGVGGYWLTNNLVFTAVLFALFVILIYLNRILLPELVSLLSKKNKELKIHYLITDYPVFALAMIVLFFLPLLIQVTVQDGSVVNAIGHYVGYVIGLAFPLVLIETKILK